MQTITENCRYYRINQNQKLTCIDNELSLWQECECSGFEHLSINDNNEPAESSVKFSSISMFPLLSIVYS